MLDGKEMIKNNILVAMGSHIDSTVMQILEAVITKALFAFDVTPRQQVPATVDNTNEYVLETYRVRNMRKLSNATMRYYINTMKEFAAFCGKPVTIVQSNDVENYLIYKKQTNQNNSANNLRRNLSAVFTWMRKNKLRLDNPVECVEAYPVEEKPIDHMEPEEYEQLKEGCRYKRDRAVLEFMRCSAARRGEVEDICIKDIDWRSGRITVNGHKTHRYRPVCIDTVAVKYIREYLEERGVPLTSPEPLFTHMRGDKTKALTGEGLYGAIRRIAKRAGMDRRVYPHLFRKTTATAIIKRGGSDEAAGEYLGHKPRSVTGKHYSYKSEEHTVRIFQDYVAAV